MKEKVNRMTRTIQSTKEMLNRTVQCRRNPASVSVQIIDFRVSHFVHVSSPCLYRFTFYWYCRRFTNLYTHSNSLFRYIDQIIFDFLSQVGQVFRFYYSRLTSDLRLMLNSDRFKDKHASLKSCCTGMRMFSYKILTEWIRCTQNCCRSTWRFDVQKPNVNINLLTANLQIYVCLNLVADSKWRFIIMRE